MKPLEDVVQLGDEKIIVREDKTVNSPFKYMFFFKYDKKIGGMDETKFNIYKYFYACCGCKEIFYRYNDLKIDNQGVFKYFESHGICPECMVEAKKKDKDGKEKD